MGFSAVPLAGAAVLAAPSPGAVALARLQSSSLLSPTSYTSLRGVQKGATDGGDPLGGAQATGRVVGAGGPSPWRLLVACRACSVLCADLGSLSTSLSSPDPHPSLSQAGDRQTFAALTGAQGRAATLRWLASPVGWTPKPRDTLAILLRGGRASRLI